MNILPGMGNVINLHPMFVHFPIVLILLALLSEIVFLISKKDVFDSAAGILLNLTAISALVAMYFGYRAADILGHDSPAHDFVHIHRDIMVWFTWLTIASAVLFRFIKSEWKGIFRFIALFVLSVILVIGTDRGAQLVFQYGMGVSQPDPEMMHQQHHHDHGDADTEDDHDMHDNDEDSDHDMHDNDDDDHHGESHKTHSHSDENKHEH